MMRPAYSKPLSVFLLICLLSTGSGCTRLQKSEHAQYGYHGTAEVQEGKRIVPLDIIGNIFGVLSKLILWNWKMERHWIKEDTQQAVKQYIEVRGEDVGHVSIQYNRYAPQDAIKRLIANKGVAAPYKYTFGLLMFVIVDVILINRIFGGDHYNPFTHTVNLYSDVPSVALHELGHAQDFASRRYRGTYAFLYILPLFNLYHEFKASENAFDYIRDEKLTKTEIEAYKMLYPAYGTYVGSYIISPIFGAIIGHIVGRMKASEFEDKVQRDEYYKAQRAVPST
jgi:hypothetical protein